MSCITVLLLGIGLSMDAFAVAVCKGLAMQKVSFKNSLIVGLWFGGFQGIMPFLGYILGIRFEKYIETVAPWIACILLVLIGGNMVKEALGKEDEEEEETDTLKAGDMLVLAIATSIDALAVGITFVCEPVQITAAWNQLVNTVAACGMIAASTCILSMCGVKIGNVFGTRYKAKAEVAGGAILILLGLKILLEAYGIIG